MAASFRVKQPGISAVLGQGIGRGLAEQVPKEIERNRLASGLRGLESEQNLTPFQQFSRLSAIPGITPQMVQSGSELLRQQGIAQGFNQQQRQPQPSPFSQTNTPMPSGGQTPQSITQKEPIKATIENYIPRSREQLVQRAGELYNENRALYPTPNDAMKAAALEDQQNQSINNAQQQSRKLQQDVQSQAEQEIKGEITRVTGNKASIPGDVISSLEDEGLDLVKSGKMTEKEAAKYIGKKALDIDRQYKDVESLGGFTLITKSPKEINNSLNSLEKKFRERGDSKHLAEKLIADSDLSPPFAYSKAYPISNTPSLAQEMNKLQPLKGKLEAVPTGGGLGSIGIRGINPKEKLEKSLDVARRLAPLMDKNSSPLSIYHELEEKGYDPEIWRNYLQDNQEKLNLTLNQVDELSKSRGTFQGFLNDLWLKAFGGK